MNTAALSMDGRIPMDSLEQAFCYLYKNGVSPVKADPLAPEIQRFFAAEGGPGVSKGFENFCGIVNSMKTGDTLAEQKFFLAGRNVAINRHPRFMPVIPHSHDFLEIQFLLSGQFSQVIGDTTVSLNEGDLCFIAPRSIHAPRVMDEDVVLINLLIRVSTLRTTFSNSLTELDSISEFLLRTLSGQTSMPMLLCRTHGDEKIHRLVLFMLSEQDNASAYTDNLLRAMMEQLFILLMRDHREDFDVGKPLRKQNGTILTILQYIQQNYTSISLSSLSRHFNYTEAHLSHLIRTATGRTFSRTVTDLRMRYVAQRLAAEDSSIMEIMTDAGYSDKTHFYRVFQQYYQTTPALYRQQNRRGVPAPPAP